MRPNMAALFQPGPGQWGLRGDPHLWQELAELAAERPLPYSEIELSDWLHAQFLDLTGQPLSAEKPIAVERYPRRGMSGGLVSPAWWREKLLPLLLQRLEELLTS